MRHVIVLLACLVATGAVAQGQAPDVDQSGHGAVLCSWAIAIEVAVGLDACFPGDYGELRADNDAAVTAMNQFIARNDSPPLTLEQIQAATDRAGEQLRAGLTALTADQRAQRCHSIGAFIKQMAAMGHAGRQRSLDDLLSVPRKPLRQPCL